MNEKIRYSALVTGATGDIGSAIVEKLIEDNYFVIALGRDTQKGKALVEKHGADNIDFRGVDLNEESNNLSDVFKNERFKKYPLHVSVACAGTLKMQPTDQVSMSDWQETINVNLTGVFSVLQESLKVMQEKGEGNLIAIGSRWGESGAKHAAAYSATKSALRGFIKSLQYELKNTNIRPILISPGSVAGKMSSSVDTSSDIKYILPKDVAGLISYVVSTPANVIFDEIKIKAYHYDLTN